MCEGVNTESCVASCDASCELECGCSGYCNEVDLVQKDSSDWSIVLGGRNGTLSYSMGTDEVMNYEFTMNSKLDADTDYCLVFYTRKDGTISWDNDDNEVWGNQSSGLIDSGKTDGSGVLGPLRGTFDFTAFGTGLDYIDDGDDYDGSVYGGKVWLVPCSDYDEGGKAVTGYHPNNFLFETDLVTPTEPCCECWAECQSDCTAECVGASVESCYEECYGGCYSESYEECNGGCLIVCTEESESTCVETCMGDCYGECYLDCGSECESGWEETYGEMEDPKLGQEHYLCKYWMDNACGYWVYMENNDTLAGFTTTPVYLIDLGDF